MGKIKEGIDQSQIKDPLKKLAEKMINNKLKFSLMKIIQKQLKKGNEAVKKQNRIEYNLFYQIS